MSATLRERVLVRVRETSWAIDANDGIISTAGLLQGFAGAGAGDRLLLFAAVAALIAGGLSAGGAKWAEVAAEREEQLRIAAVPLAITFLAPVAIETSAILVAVVVSLALTSLVAAGVGRISALRMLARTLVVGLGTMAASYVAGLVFF
ncbi:VIT1/CCC1 transporter family protein [Cellulosimicrobium cellulans]|uniref:VIT1/CCC1 transporter family protein n=1 Tax=Cellulosimicrobium cellulans TaxID=1710 RepID=UPI0037FEA944